MLDTAHPSTTPAKPGGSRLPGWGDWARPILRYDLPGTHPIAQSAAAAGFHTVDQLSMVNVAVQVQTLIKHPLVADAHREGQLSVIGLIYDIATAQVLKVDSTRLAVVEDAEYLTGR